MAGCLSVATDVGGIAEVVEEGVTGWLCAPGSPEGLGAAMARALADPRASARIAEAARERVRERFSVDAVLRAYLDLYGRDVALPS